MTKLIIILLIVAGLAVLGVTFVMKSARRFFSAFAPTQEQQKTTGRDNKYNKVIYEKNDVVVLKGEAKNDKKEKNKSKRFFNKSNDKYDR